MSDQSHLDTDVQALNDALLAIEAEIAALKEQAKATLPASQPMLDFTALDEVVAKVRGDLNVPPPSPTTTTTTTGTTSTITNPPGDTTTNPPGY